MTFEKMTRLIFSCVDAEGNPITIEKFEKGRKKLAHLFGEIDQREVDLEKDPKTGRLNRSAVSVRTLIRHLKSRQALQEFARRFENGDYVEKLKAHGSSEMRIREEEIRKTAIRAILQEFGIMVLESELLIPLITSEAFLTLGERIDVHESSVYYATLSHVLVYELEWHPFDRSVRSLLGEILSAAREPDLFSHPKRFLKLLYSFWKRGVLWTSLHFGLTVTIREKTGERIYTRWEKH